jgi:HTH-type transcriptional regulator, sugar sensing transcriptional regulator
MEKVYEFLKQFGLSDLETKLYLGLLETGPTTVLEIAKHTGIKRTTAHVNIETLIEKGLVAQTKSGTRRKILAEEPEKLEYILKREEMKLEELNSKLPSVLATVEGLRKTSSAFSTGDIDVRYYEGELGFKEVCQRSILSAKKEVLFISNVAEWRKVYSTEYGKKYYVPEREKHNIRLRQLAVDNKEAKDMQSEDAKSFRETRILPPEYSNIEPTIIITDDEVSYMFSSKPYRAILIKDKSLAEVWRITFEKLWIEGKKS